MIEEKQIRIFYSLQLFEFVFLQKKNLHQTANRRAIPAAGPRPRLISWEENSRKTNELHFQRHGIDSSFDEGANIHLSFSLAEFDRIERHFIYFSYMTKEK